MTVLTQIKNQSISLLNWLKTTKSKLAQNRAGPKPSWPKTKLARNQTSQLPNWPKTKLTQKQSGPKPNCLKT